MAAAAHPINSVAIGSRANVLGGRVRAKCEQEDRSAGRAVLVAGCETFWFCIFDEIGVDQQRPLAAARSVRESELHQIMMCVQHHQQCRILSPSGAATLGPWK